jgi:hypothetical protein
MFIFGILRRKLGNDLSWKLLVYFLQYGYEEW